MELDGGGGRARQQQLLIALLAIAFKNVVRIIYSTDHSVNFFAMLNY